MRTTTLLLTCAFLLCALCAYAEQKDMTPLSMKAGDTVANFKLVRVETVPEVDAIARLFVHEKSGARLLYLSNADTNKVFSITFRTPPSDDTGIAHILEHSVLCGSRKFPTKEPFVELIKGSMSTFLNAFTAPDWTMYPVASKNDKDFLNLVDVYMDAVFYPSLLTNPFVMMQEGWHYEIDPQSNALAYNGVVYNEMRGVFSDVESIVQRRTQNILFPNNTYRYESGGDPACIPQLTQEQFVDFHDKFYSPSNSYIYLYGNGNVQEHLDFLDREYLSHFEKKAVDSAIPLQRPFDMPKDAEVKYSINDGDTPTDKACLSYSFVLGRAYEAEDFLSFDILARILVDNEAAPLKRALLETGIGREVSTQWNVNEQLSLTVFMTGSNADQKQRFVDTIEKTLTDLVENGLDKDLVEAMINKKELELRELESQGLPKGLLVGMDLVLPAWLYDRDPLTHVRYTHTLADIRKAAKGGYFEKLIRRFFLKNNHKAVMTFVPVPGLQAEEDAALQKKLAEVMQGMDKGLLDRIRADAAELRTRQTSPDKPEDLARIPLLNLSDINPAAEVWPINAGTLDGVTYLTHPMFTNGLTYVNVLFDTRSVPADLLPYIGLLKQALGKLSTSRRSFLDLEKAINLNGMMDYDFQVIPDNSSMDNVHPWMFMKATLLSEKLDTMLDLMQEVALSTRFDDKARLKEIVKEAYADARSEMVARPNTYALRRASSYLGQEGAYADASLGLGYVEFLSKLETDFDARADETTANLKKVADLILIRENVLISLASDEKAIDAAKDPVVRFVNAFPSRPQPSPTLPLRLNDKREGFVLPSQVNYVAAAANYRALGLDYSGTFNVLTNVIFSDYLWNNVRVQGGAYGASIRVSRSGLLGLSSYRDPNIGRTLDVYRQTRDFLLNFKPDDREMTKFIIGAVSDLEPALPPREKALRATARFIAGITQADIQKEREQTLKTTAEDIRALSPLFEKAPIADDLCVIGGSQKVNAEAALFRSITNLPN